MENQIVNELHLQDKFLIPFFTAQNGTGLSYQEVPPNTVNQSLIIKNDLQNFLQHTDLNKKPYQKLIHQFKGDEQALITAIMLFLQNRLKDYRNMALFINNNRKIVFEGIELNLFYTSGSELRNDELFEQNIFSVVQELAYKYDYNDREIFSFRPDISLFVNGLYLGYSELKSNYTNQSAHKNGRAKVAKDYRNAVWAYLQHIDADKDLTDTDKCRLRKDMLKVFEKAVLISTTDLEETYILRDIARSFKDIKQDYDNNKFDAENYQKRLYQRFKSYPLNSKSEDKQDKLKEIFSAHYAKKMQEKEILYFNFIEREVVAGADGKTFKNEKGYLISPRPKQKFGVDKIMAKIDDFLNHEHDPDYFIQQLKSQLHGISEAQKQELIEKRLRYQNNKNIYSLLLQYAAGFGKSNIIGWTALQLKDLKKDNAYVYDKVLLIVDRLQLRDQLANKLFNMNINNSMYLEASDRSSFKKALSSNIRLVIVNIQKFNGIAEIIGKDSLKKMASLRVVFLIDEIHRSNNGEQNQEMISSFDELQNQFDNDKNYSKTVHKKNLIIGFTATPSDHTLARFGEFNKYAEGEKLWRPFDSYTMREAITDGYILNPLDGIVPISAKMYFELPKDILKGFEDKDSEKVYRILNKKIYENDERIDAIAKYIAQFLVKYTYKQIRGYAKAMLAAASIKSAIKYKDRITYHFNKIVQEEKFSRFNDAGIYIVYSDSQEHQRSSNLNKDLSEEKVLQAFMQNKNGLMIVVDKLQTGFDEPKLHTLFLDKEIKGINAIQTISRVNRTTAHKIDCRIVDFSYKNVNVSNIKTAFEHFSDVVVSDFDPLNMETVLELLYKDLKNSVPYRSHFAAFLKLFHIRDSIKLDIENSLTDFIKKHPNESKELKYKINRYFHILELITGVISLPDKYSEAAFLDFFKRFNHIYNTLNRSNSAIDNVTIYFDNNIGIVEPFEKPIKEPKPPFVGIEIPEGGFKYNILEEIAKRNKEEEAIKLLIEDFEKHIEMLFEFVRSQDDSQDLIAKIRGNRFSEEEIKEDFRKIYDSFIRRKKLNLSEFFIQETEKLFDKLYDDFAESVK